MGLFNKKSKSIIAIDIGTKTIKFAEGKYTKKGVVIDKTFTIDTPEGAYIDGDVLNAEIVGKAIRKAVSNNGVSTDYAYLTVNSSRIITRDIEMPKVKESEIPSMVQFQIEEYIPVNSENYTVRTLFNEYGSSEDGETLRMLLIGMPTNIIEGHSYIIESANLRPVIMDYQGNSIKKLIGMSEEINGEVTEGKTYVITDIGCNTTKINIIDDGKLRVSRVVEMGLSEDSLIEDLADRINMIVRYYTSRDESHKVDKMIITGGNIDKDIADQLGDFLELDTDVFRGSSFVEYNGNIQEYANAIGSIIRMDGV